MATADQLAVIREHCGRDIATVGSVFPTRDIDARLARHRGDALLAALSVARTQLADMANDPAQWSTNQDTTENWSANLTVLRARVATLEKLTASGTADRALAPKAGQASITRPDRGRR